MILQNCWDINFDPQSDWMIFGMPKIDIKLVNAFKIVLVVIDLKG